jgi:hypothetical protein
MLPIPLIVAVGFLFTGCAATRDAAQQRQFPGSRATDNASRDQAFPQPVPIYLHLFSPRYYTDPPIPPALIVSARIRLGEEFAIPVGSATSRGDEVLAGRVDQRGTKFFARLFGRSHTTLNRFEGEMELEKPVESQGGGFSGAIWTARFVLSTNADCAAFLKE